MTDYCLNPDCDRQVDVIGVCFGCANSYYNPNRDGVDVDRERGITTRGNG